MSVGGIETFHQIFNDLIFENIQVTCPSFYHSTYGTEEDLKEAVLNQIERALRTRGDEIVGVVMEPLIQGATGLFVHPKGFLKGVEQLCRQYDVLMIVDEVATGFGRTGELFACDHEQVEPDIMCLGKSHYWRLFTTRCHSDVSTDL